MIKAVYALCALLMMCLSPGYALADTTGYHAILSCPALPPVAAPAQQGPVESACSKRYQLAWQGQIPESYVGQKGMDFFNSRPAGWNTNPLFSGAHV